MVHLFDITRKQEVWRVCCIVGRILSVMHIACSIYSVYFYVITNFGKIGALQYVVGALWDFLGPNSFLTFLKGLGGTSGSGCTYSTVWCDPRFSIILTRSKLFIGRNRYICARVRSYSYNCKADIHSMPSSLYAWRVRTCVPPFSNICRMISDIPLSHSGQKLFSYTSMACGTSQPTGNAFFLNHETNSLRSES